MGRKYHRDFLGNPVAGSQDVFQDLFFVHVRGPVEGEDRIISYLSVSPKAQFIKDSGFLGGFDVFHQRVDHHIADKEDSLLGNSFGPQIASCVLTGREEIIRDLVGHEPIDLLRHGPVEASQAGFDMGYKDGQFGGDEGAGCGRVDVADDDDQIGLLFEAHSFEFDHDFPGLLGMASGPDTEVDIRRRNPQVAEKGAGHIIIVMLAGVDNDRFKK
jgi:hypothetical protein